MKILGLLGCFLRIFQGFLGVRKAREILGVFEVFLGIFIKTKEKKDRLLAWYQGRFFRTILGHSWGLVYGEGGAPGMVPLHNLRGTSHVLHQDVPLGWYQVRFF